MIPEENFLNYSSHHNYRFCSKGKRNNLLNAMTEGKISIKCLKTYSNLLSVSHSSKNDNDK